MVGLESAGTVLARRVQILCSFNGERVFVWHRESRRTHTHHTLGTDAVKQRTITVHAAQRTLPHICVYAARFQ